MQNEIIRQRLYRVFRIREEDYIVTVKLFYIYKWIEPRTGNDAFEILGILRKATRGISNLEKINGLYHAVKMIGLKENGYMSAAKAAPMNRNQYVAGWHL